MSLEESLGRQVSQKELPPDLIEVGATSLRISSRSDGPQRVVVLEGELDLSTAPLLLEHLTALLTNTMPELLLDLSALSFLDSTGISVLIAAHRRLAGQGGRMVLLSPTPLTQRVLEIAGLTTIFSIVPASGV